MMALAAAALFLGAVLGGPVPAAPTAPAADPAALQAAAALYHQGRFDSARDRLTGLLDAPGWRRRDTLVVLQYLGMSEARLGADSAATARFLELLAADSLFRFPRNEDAAVLRTFQAARDLRAAPAPLAAAAAAPAMNPSPGTSASEAAAPENAHPETAPARDPLATLAAEPLPAARMTLPLGAVPLGGGWLARRQTAHGLTLGFLQAGGLLLSIYASDRQNGMENDRFYLEPSEEGSARGWQWVQRISLSTALGAYLYSLIASRGD